MSSYRIDHCPSVIQESSFWERDFLSTLRVVQIVKRSCLNVKRLLLFYQCKLLFGVTVFILRLRMIISNVNYSLCPALLSKSMPLTINNGKIVFVYCCNWMIVMLWALIYRWAGGSAEKDIYKMDQFPLGKGKSVWLFLTATASMVLSIYTNTGGVCRLKTFPSHCLFTSSHVALSCFTWHRSISKTYCRAGHGTGCVS